MKDRYLINTTWSTADVIYGSMAVPSYKLTIESLYVYIPVSDEQKMRNNIRFWRRILGYLLLYTIIALLVCELIHPALIIPYSIISWPFLIRKFDNESDALEDANNKGTYVLKDDPTLRS